MFICIKIECVLWLFIYEKIGVNKCICFYRWWLLFVVIIEVIVVYIVKLCIEVM